MYEVAIAAAHIWLLVDLGSFGSLLLFVAVNLAGLGCFGSRFKPRPTRIGERWTPFTYVVPTALAMFPVFLVMSPAQLARVGIGWSVLVAVRAALLPAPKRSRRWIPLSKRNGKG